MENITKSKQLERKIIFLEYSIQHISDILQNVLDLFLEELDESDIPYE